MPSSSSATLRTASIAGTTFVQVMLGFVEQAAAVHGDAMVFSSAAMLSCSSLTKAGHLVERVGVERVADGLQVGTGHGQFALVADGRREDHRLGHLDAPAWLSMLTVLQYCSR